MVVCMPEKSIRKLVSSTLAKTVAGKKKKIALKYYFVTVIKALFKMVH